MRSALSILALAGAYLACFVAIRVVRRRPAALAAPLALSLLVCVETFLARALSAFGAVRPAPVLAAHLALLAAGVLLAWRFPAARRACWPRRMRGRWHLVPLAALFLLAAISALAYRPNNWDSMTYHLARVAHWIQHRSVTAYVTGIPRQNVLSPGAEYLLLTLQVISGSDRLAGLVQLGAWVVLVGAVAPLARAFGAPRVVGRAAAVVVGAAPLVVLEASSTQNDLVAAAAVAGVVAACLPLLHRRRRWRGGDLLLLVGAVGGALLVKPTGLLFAAPLLLAAGLGWLRSARGTRAFAEAAPALALAAVLLPAGVPRLTEAAPVAGRYVYAGVSEPVDRVVNAARGVLRNLPYADAAGDALAPASTEGCAQPHRLCLAQNRAPSEDSAGNPALAVLALAAVALGALRWRRISGLARLGALALVLGWLVFHASVRDNVWIPRLQLPAVALVAAAMGALPRAPGRRSMRAGLGALVALAVAHGGWAAVHDVRRPLLVRALRRAAEGASTYYEGGPAGLADRHAGVLAELGRSRCRRLGLHLGADSYDYPLTWRAMGLGVEVRHLLALDDWPCAVFSDLGPPPARPDGRPWVETAIPGYFVPATPTASMR